MCEVLIGRAASFECLVADLSHQPSLYRFLLATLQLFYGARRLGSWKSLSQSNT